MLTIIFCLNNSIYLGLKIITGLVRSNNIELAQNDLEILYTEFLIKRWK